MNASYGLLNKDLTQIKPNYETMFKGGHLKMNDLGAQQGEIR